MMVTVSFLQDVATLLVESFQPSFFNLYLFY